MTTKISNPENKISNITKHAFTAVKQLKKYILFIAFFIISCCTMANPPIASKQELGMFKNSLTCVVLEDGSISYNVFIKGAVQSNWKYTNFEFIGQKEFENRRFDSRYSFLVLMKGVYDNDPGGVSYDYISLVLGNKTLDMTKMPEICSIPITYSDNKDSDYGYAIPAIVNFMQKYAKDLEEKRFFISLFGLKYYNGPDGFKDKVLLLNKEEMALDANSAEKIKNTYPYHFKLISTSAIEEELSKNPMNTIFNFHVGPGEDKGAGKCFEMIFDNDGNLYYYNYRKITNDNKDGFNQKDLKRIG